MCRFSEQTRFHSVRRRAQLVRDVPRAGDAAEQRPRVREGLAEPDVDPRERQRVVRVQGDLPEPGTEQAQQRHLVPHLGVG